MKRHEIWDEKSRVTVYHADTPREALDKMARSRGHRSWQTLCAFYDRDEAFAVRDGCRIIL